MARSRPNSSWAGLDGLKPESGRLYDQIHSVLSTVDFDELQRVALLTRLSQDEAVDPEVSCAIDPSSFARGFNNVVFEVLFSDNVSWIARIQHAPIDASRASRNALNLLSEIATMKTVKARTTIPVPQVFSFDTSPYNPVGFPYILMEYLGGGVLDDMIASAVPSEHLPKVAEQIAEVLFQLQGLAFDRLGRLWCGEDGNGPPEIIPLSPAKTSSPTLTPKSSLDWFYAHIGENNRRALEKHYDDPQWKTACRVLMTAAPLIVIEDRLHGPFPLCHLDLHYGNMLFDDDYNLTGIIDWSHAQTVPMERLAVSPEFITFPAAPDEINEGILTFISLVKENLQNLENMQFSEDDSSDGSYTSSYSSSDDNLPGETSSTLLSDIFGSKRADITHRCTYSLPHRALWDGKLVAGLMFGEAVTWDQIVGLYSGLDIN